MSTNLCINGEAITNSILSSESGHGPEKAFDDDITTTYASESYVRRIKPYCGYKFTKPVKIHKIYLFQATFR